jgi:hypothetical protein
LRILLDTKSFGFFIHYLVFFLLKLIINVYSKSYKISSQWLLINRISPQTMFFIVHKIHPIENVVSFKNLWIFYTLPGFLLLQLIINVYYKTNKITWQLLLINRISPQTIFYIVYKIHTFENIVSYKNIWIFYTLPCFFAFETYYKRFFLKTHIWA